MINILNKNQIKILHIADNHDRHNGRLYYSTVKKINNGLIKNDYNVIQLSDRDYLKRNIFNYKKKFFIKKLISTIKNFKPNIILFGHVDSLSEDDFYDLKNMFKDVIFSQWFLVYGGFGVGSLFCLIDWLYWVGRGVWLFGFLCIAFCWSAAYWFFLVGGVFSMHCVMIFMA